MAYIPIRTSTIRGDHEILFDVFVRLNEKKYIRYVKSKDEFEDKRLSRLKAKQIKKLYILAEDENSYLSYLDNNLKKVAEDSKITVEQKADIIHGATSTAVEGVFTTPTDDSKIDFAKNVLNTQISFLQENKMGLSSLMNLENYSFDIYQHSVNVANLASALAMKLKLNKKETLETLSMGALLHDIGKTTLTLDQAVLPEKLSPKELAVYKTHPQKGVEMFANSKVSESVKEIIYCHEELINGDGYPRGLKGKEINQLTQIVSITNVYDRFITFNRLGAKETWKNMTINNLGIFDIELLNTLKACLKEQGLL